MARLNARGLLSLRGAVLPLGALSLWWMVTSLGLVRGPLVVTPVQVVAVPFLDASGRELWAALGTSMARVLAGGLIGGLIGLTAGYLTGLYRLAALGLSPTVHSIRQVALFAWIPLLTAWFGNGEATKLVFTALSAFFPLFLATEQGIRQVPRPLVDVASVLNLTYLTRITKLYLPAALPSIYIGLQIAVLSAWIGTIGAEYAIGNGRGLGSFIASGRDQFRMDIVLAGVITLAAGGVLLNSLATRLSHALSPWTKDLR
ncbi:sulfonate transport system permease protein [Rhizobium sp. RU35A]|uniref:ABC transporter permease subunit n=1 Tax=Rhizobium straminoryzae TaxID=1387186 RepID=A0A549TH88_9HYPH|nr:MULTISPECIES: ABC transporter permease subunit [Rhizobium]TRL42302.1 ABC transporter permease subunit [Rhizobium straminoryzae]SIR35301.1 sulfonate transport system permease protein [Rhizobium sp. RU35A]